MKNRTTQKLYRKGFYHEITEDVGPIPKGIYKISEVAKDFVVFCPGKKVIFSIAGDWKKYVRPTLQNRALVLRTTQDKFLDRYYELLEIHRANPEPFSPLKPFTMCFVDPSMAREVH